MGIGDKGWLLRRSLALATAACTSGKLGPKQPIREFMRIMMATWSTPLPPPIASRRGAPRFLRP